jgi:phosphohistidine phosphatase SixA
MKSSHSILRGRPRRPLALLALACALLVSQFAGASANTPQAGEEFKAMTIFLVRHAEKADAPPEDPPLSEAGRGRAQELARLLGPAGVKAVYTSQFLRTKQTGEPLAAQLGLTVAPVALKMSASNPRAVSDESIAEIVRKIHEQAGGGVLVIGHSNTIPEVIRALGGDDVPKIDEKKFDDLFVVTVYAKGKAKVVRMKYGSQN